MNSEDSDDDLLVNLLATAKDDASTLEDTYDKPIKLNALKELDFNFLDVNSGFFDESFKIESDLKKDPVSLLENDKDSSDDEDKKYFEKQRYTEYGKEIKQLLKNKESENTSFDLSFKNSNNLDGLTNNITNTSKSKNFFTKINNSYSVYQKGDKNELQVCPNTLVKKDVYSDPIFGLRIVRPLISSADLVEKMKGRKAVTVSSIKLHLMNQSAGNSNEDWVIAGVLLNNSSTKTSQKGNQYCIWTITDLSTDMKKISIFLFKDAYKHFWKITTGVVIGILNPSVMESREDKDLATLSVDNAKKILIMGNSMDLGKCKSTKKNGDPCTAPINLRNGEYCIYHVKQEYGKYSKRSELMTLGSQTFGPSNNVLKKGLSQQRHPEALPFIAIPAKRNETQYKKDRERLALLRGEVAVKKNKVQAKVMPETKIKAASVELSTNQVKKDFEKLNKLREQNAKKQIDSPFDKQDFKLSLSTPKLGVGLKGAIIDFSEPIPKNHVNNAKIKALEWVRKNGSIKKTNPNKIHQEKEILNEKGIKRKREEEEEKIVLNVAEKETAVGTKFQEMMEMKSTHSDLIEKRENEETEQYFKKLEAKEKMEENMLTTYKVECKAVRCSVCKYIAFSSSDLCKKLQHPIKVIDVVKRFFKCGDCGNRTISLDRIPKESCKRCFSSKWLRTAMMDEKRTEIATSKLCIRGGEEKFIGSTVTDASLNLLIPETD